MGLPTRGSAVLGSRHELHTTNAGYTAAGMPAVCARIYSVPVYSFQCAMPMPRPAAAVA